MRNFFEELYDDFTSVWFQRLNNIIKWLTELCALVALVSSGTKSVFAKIVKAYLWVDVIFQGIQIVLFPIAIGVQLITGQTTWQDVKELYKEKVISTKL